MYLAGCSRARLWGGQQSIEKGQSAARVVGILHTVAEGTEKIYLPSQLPARSSSTSIPALVSSVI